MAGAVGSFAFPGSDPQQYSATSYAPFKPTTSEGREPKVAYFNTTNATPAAPSALLSFFRVTTYQPIRLYRITVNALRLSSTGTYGTIDSLTVTLTTLAGSTWPNVSPIPGTYGINTFNNQQVSWFYSPQYGAYEWKGPLYVSPGIQFQLVTTAYASYAAGDTVAGNATVMWDTM